MQKLPRKFASGKTFAERRRAVLLQYFIDYQPSIRENSLAISELATHMMVMNNRIHSGFHVIDSIIAEINRMKAFAEDPFTHMNTPPQPTVH